MRAGAAPVQPPRRSGGILDIVLLVVALAALSSLGYFGFAFITGKGPQPPRAIEVAATQSQPVEAETWTDEDSATCETRARRASQEPLPADAILTQRSVTDGFPAMATRVACRLSIKPTRFCNPEQKQELVAMVDDYLERVDLIVLGLNAQGAPLKLMSEFMGAEAKMGSAVYDMQAQSTIKVMEQHDKKVTTALQALTRDGIVSPDDFAAFLGMGVPKRIKTMLGGVTVEQHVCA